MAYSLTQARPLLTAAELELFDQSRAEPIKALTLARLRGKVTRARTLRDKYRDLFRRQTVAVRSGPATQGRAPAGADNERTQRKADILQEVLGRFEARLAQLEARDAREASRVSPAAPKARSPAAVKKKAVQPAQNGAVRTKNVKAAPAAKAVPTVKAAPAAKAVPTVKAAPATKAAPQLRAAAPADKPLDAAVLNQHATRSLKAPSDKAPTTNGKAQAPQTHAPIDMLPSALRANPLKQAPGNIAKQGHQSASMRRAQGKRDSR